ncbi:DUF4180 domain-containing protein [Streptomyces barkulensis]|uniref:DUF4180 domain-containing protein n=1 Tax=Streptomyces barkulensis TaxID=1257026 RepID=UPI000C6D3E1C|nr:DUF4180 domain-containing protein [Streptomyces barkulensis]
MTTLRTFHGIPVLMCADEGAAIGEREALDLIGDAGYQGARWVAVPAGRLHEDFFRLRTGLAGEIVQKFANYRLGLAVVGDVSARTAAGTALRDFVRECDRGRQTWFVADETELAERLAP